VAILVAKAFTVVSSLGIDLWHIGNAKPMEFARKTLARSKALHTICQRVAQQR
jgi:hypothetical protein